jgi:hypothetical protein
VYGRSGNVLKNTKLYRTSIYLSTELSGKNNVTKTYNSFPDVLKCAMNAMMFDWLQRMARFKLLLATVSSSISVVLLPGKLY